jgi:hypothetical protein
MTAPAVVRVRVMRDRYATPEAQVYIDAGGKPDKRKRRRVMLYNNLNETIPGLYAVMFDKVCEAVQEHGRGIKIRLESRIDGDWSYEVGIVARVIAAEFNVILEGFAPEKRGGS